MTTFEYDLACVHAQIEDYRSEVQGWNRIGHVSRRHLLLPYKEHVARWAHCAPEGARLLPAPLQGWDGTPCTSRNPQGPWGVNGPAMRAALTKVGKDPINPYRMLAS